jgi:hypothetical protein
MYPTTWSFRLFTLSRGRRVFQMKDFSHSVSDCRGIIRCCDALELDSFCSTRLLRAARLKMRLQATLENHVQSSAPQLSAAAVSVYAFELVEEATSIDGGGSAVGSGRVLVDFNCKRNAIDLGRFSSTRRLRRRVRDAAVHSHRVKGVSTRPG